ncbi:MAG: hypothetical protein JWM68_2510 [Verrucomicrobiales bacterium]|nr:hypothetical protein [Verrucomicrobiales bacterium]
MHYSFERRKRREPKLKSHNLPGEKHTVKEVIEVLHLIGTVWFFIKEVQGIFL